MLRTRLSTICRNDTAFRLVISPTFNKLYSNKMPKKTEKSKKHSAVKANTSSSLSSSTSNDPVTENSNGTVTIRVLAKPGAKYNAITDITTDGVGIQIAAPPVDGEANTELVKFLAKFLALRKSDITFDKGSRSRSKSLTVSGVTKDSVLAKLQAGIDS